MFKEFVSPYLEEQCEKLDFAVYHLDGDDCIRHRYALLGISGLKAIQWTPQSGWPGTGSATWYGRYKRILRAGKSLLLLDVEPHHFEPLLHSVDTKGVLIATTARTIDEAHKLLHG